ncbi:MAG: hypothetical protein AAFX06_21405 [Planctomycetota bacterium]
MEPVEVIPVGSTVSIGDGIEGRITQIGISASGVTYEVTWWNGRTRVTAWISELEIENAATRQPIGFAQEVGTE